MAQGRGRFPFLEVTSLTDGLQRWRLRRQARSGTIEPKEFERLGEADIARPSGALIWLHGAALSDLSAFMGLVPRLEVERGESFTLLLTTEEAPPKGSLPPEATHQLAPFDTAPATGRFLDHWTPDLVVMCGENLLASAIDHCATRAIPTVWCDGIAPKPGVSFRPRLSSIRKFSQVFTVSNTDRIALTEAGVDADRIAFVGPLLEEAVALPCDEQERDRMAAALASRPVWLAMGAVQEDLPAIHTAHRHAARRSHRMLLILRPGHGAKAANMAAALMDKGWTVALRSEHEDPAPETQVLVTDGTDEDGLWYRLAPITYFGGTFSTRAEPGNPLEAAALGSAILHGPLVGAQRSRFDRLASSGATHLIHTAEGLGPALEALLSPDKAAIMAEAAWRVASDGADATDKVIDRLTEVLDAPEYVQ